MPPSKLQLYERVVPELPQLLSDMNDDGETLVGMVIALRDQHDINVSTETVRRWLRKLGIREDPEPEQ